MVDDAASDLRIRMSSASAAVRSLSGGNQQRVVLAKWLARDPRVLILNSPTVGVDVGSKSEILDMLRAKGREGMAIVVISDDVPELVAVCHRVLVVRRGRISDELAGRAAQRGGHLEGAGCMSALVPALRRLPVHRLRGSNNEGVLVVCIIVLSLVVGFYRLLVLEPAHSAQHRQRIAGERRLRDGSPDRHRVRRHRRLVHGDRHLRRLQRDRDDQPHRLRRVQRVGGFPRRLRNRYPPRAH